MAFDSGSTLQQTDNVAASSLAASIAGGGGGGGTAIEVIQLDASSGNVTEPLPEPEDGAQVLYIRTDNTEANTVTIEDPNGNDIRTPGEVDAPSFKPEPYEWLFFFSDGTSWFVDGLASFGGRAGSVDLQEIDTTGVVENQLATTFPGSPPPDALMMQHIFQDRFTINEAIIYADTSPSSAYSVTATIAGTTYTITVGGASPNPNTKTIDQIVTAQDVLRLVSQSTSDDQIADVTVAFDMDSIPEPSN